jgi:hypothetical protein
MTFVISAAVLTVAAVGAVSLVKYRRSIRMRQMANRARAIFAAGGPRTSDEFFFLFPNACRKCGSRRCTARTDVDYDGARCYACYCTVFCASGHILLDRAYLGWTDRGHELPNIDDCSSVVESYNKSPYLTDEEASILVEIWTDSVECRDGGAPS